MKREGRAMMTVEELRKELGKYPATAPVVLVVDGGIQYQIVDVWWMGLEGPQGVVCLGDDPR